MGLSAISWYIQPDKAAPLRRMTGISVSRLHSGVMDLGLNAEALECLFLIGGFEGLLDLIRDFVTPIGTPQMFV